MTRRSRGCDDASLLVLLDGAEGSAEFHRAAAHVDACAACQQRLEELAGQRTEWTEVREMLCPLEGDDRDTGELWRYHAPAGRAQRATIDETQIKPLLAAPSHPEMLGRLGRYEIERVIGAGGMGVVLKAFDSELNRPVAIKMLAPHLARIGAARQRFAREARAAAAVVHEHVVAIHNVESDPATPYLVMQFVPGESLQARVERSGPLSAAEVLRIGMQAASGLAAAHAQGLVHRDVKPGNILLENDVERAYLTDFGLARATDDASLTHTGVVAGTPHYMSPEQADGQAVDHRSDLFSLGSVLYFMATGHPPFRAERPLAVLKRTCLDRHRPVREVSPRTPHALSRIIDRLLEKSPERRFTDAEELRRALAETLSDVQQGRSNRNWLARIRDSRHGRTLVTGIAVLAIVVAIVLDTRPSGDGPRNEVHESTPAAGGAENSSNAAASPAAELLRADPSPSEKFRMETDRLDAELRELESSPYPEETLNGVLP